MKTTYPSSGSKRERLYSFSIISVLCFIIILILALFFSPAQSPFAADINLAWNSNTESDLDGYKVYYKTGSSGAPYNGTGAAEGNSPITIPLDDLSDLDNPLYILHGLSDSETYYCVITAYNTDGDESGFSNEVTYQFVSSSTLIDLSISGDDSVIENNSGNYTATALFSDGSTQTVTNLAAWSENSPSSSISSRGVLTTSEVSSDETVTVGASYTHNAVTETATRVVTIKNIPPSNLPPDTPAIAYPYDGQAEVEVPLSVTTGTFTDPDGDSHSQSRWQISEEDDFSTLVLDVTSDSHLMTLPVPHTVLKPNHAYYVRVRFYDVYSAVSDWSNPAEFTTTFFLEDLNSDGIPDAWEVDATVDFNLNGTPDIYEPENIKCVRATDGMVNIGVEKISDSISSIEALDVIDPANISDTVNRPDDITFGLFSYRLRVNQPGATASVRVYFSAGIFESDSFFKYDTINGWYNYSEHTTFNDDGQSVILELRDGGYGDSDGVANGIIVDPGGIASGDSTYTGASTSTDESSGGSCFIATAAYGSPVERHVSILKDFRDVYLVSCAPGRMIARTYYKHSPQMAIFIEKHNILKAVVAFSLIPLIAFSNAALHFGLAIALIMVSLIFILSIILIMFILPSSSKLMRS